MIEKTAIELLMTEYAPFYTAIINCLNDALPESYDRDIFAAKSNRVYQHIVDKALMGYAWVA